MSTVITWRLAHPDHDSYVRFFVIDDHLFQLMRLQGKDAAPFGYASVSVKDVHLDAVVMAADLEANGYRFEPSRMLHTETVVSPDELLHLVRVDPAKAQTELRAIVMNAIMVGGELS